MKPRLVPALDWLARYEGAWLRADVMAGLTTAAVVIPKAMAYATIAGLPVQIGLYTALVPMAVYVALGSSRVLSVSTTTTLGILAAAALADAVAERRARGARRRVGDARGAGGRRSCSRRACCAWASSPTSSPSPCSPASRPGSGS